jgi:hypothetical protein
MSIDTAVTRSRLDAVLGAVYLDLLTEDQDPKQADDHHGQDREHEAVGRNREQRAGLSCATQVERHQQHGNRGGYPGLVAIDDRKHRLGVLDSRGDGDRDGQHIVHQQRRSNGKPSVGAQVDRGDLIVAAT